MKKEISIVIPARNEEESLNRLLRKFKKYKNYYKEIIIVDGKSTDQTIQISKKHKCTVIKQRGLGYGDAIIKGVNHVETKYFIVFDADGSKDPIYIKDFYSKMMKEKVDIVFAERYGVNAGSLDDTALTYIGNRIFTILGKIFFGLKLNDILHTFFLCEVKKFKKLKFKYKNFAFCVEFPINAKRDNFIFSSIPTIERKRYDGIPKVRSFIDGAIILSGMINLFFKR